MNRLDEESRYGRIINLAPPPQLQIKRPLVVGNGSMGNPVALQQVRHGVGTQSPGRITCIDGDFVKPRNFIGTHFRESHEGMPKAQATAEMLQT